VIFLQCICEYSQKAHNFTINSSHLVKSNVEQRPGTFFAEGAMKPTVFLWEPYNIFQHWCRRRGASAPQNFWFGENPGKICGEIWAKCV